MLTPDRNPISLFRIRSGQTVTSTSSTLHKAPLDFSRSAIDLPCKSSNHPTADLEGDGNEENVIVCVDDGPARYCGAHHRKRTRAKLLRHVLTVVRSFRDEVLGRCCAPNDATPVDVVNP
jgi:hypothetical protein